MCSGKTNEYSFQRLRSETFVAGLGLNMLLATSTDNESLIMLFNFLETGLYISFKWSPKISFLENRLYISRGDMEWNVKLCFKFSLEKKK